MGRVGPEYWNDKTHVHDPVEVGAIEQEQEKDQDLDGGKVSGVTVEGPDEQCSGDDEVDKGVGGKVAMAQEE